VTCGPAVAIALLRNIETGRLTLSGLYSFQQISAFSITATKVGKGVQSMGQTVLPFAAL
jgi:hypothetical protein